MKRKFTASVWREDEWYVAQCLEVDVASQGRTEHEALANLADALRLYFSSPSPGALPELRTIDVEVTGFAPPAVP